jgi:diguanylate cyclase (GGDEF)-like protein
MNRTSVQVPIILGFAALLLILFAVVASNVYQINTFGTQIRAIVLERNKKSDLAAVMNELHRARYRSLLHASVLSDPFRRDEEISYFRELAREFIKARDQFTALPLDDSEMATWQMIRGYVRNVEAEAEVIQDALQDDKLDEAQRMIKDRLAPMQERMMAGWTQLLYVQGEKNREALLQSERIDRDVRRMSIVLGSIALVIGLAVAILAIRGSRRLEEALLEEKERAQVTLASISEAVIRLNARGEVSFLNPYAEFLLGARLEGEATRDLTSVLQLLDGASRESILGGLIADLKRGIGANLPAGTRLVTGDGMEYEVDGSIAPLGQGLGGGGAVLVLRDVTENHDSLRRRSGCLGVDPVTGLADALQIEERLGSALLGKRAKDQPLAFILARLDNLEAIRAQGGNESLNRLMLHIARQLSMQVRDSDLIGHMDDNTLGILLPSCSEEKANAIAEAVRAALGSLRPVPAVPELGVAARVGVVCIPPFTGTLHDCLRAAGAD